MKKLFILLICSMTILTSCQFAHTKTPPPIQASYRGLTPEGMTQEAIRSRLIEHYHAWATTYIKKVPNSNQKYVDYIVDERLNPDNTWVSKQAVTVSEAHGYGMLILTNMASIDYEHSTNYQEDFDDFVRFYMNHRSTIQPAFMCWQMISYGYDTNGLGEVTTIINTPDGADSATDGDLDIAYSLILADKLWGSNGEFNYMQMAKKINHAILTTLIAEDHRILIGDWVQESPSHQPLTRTSDLLIRNFYALRNIDPDTLDQWNQIITKTQKIVNQLYTNYSGNTGLMPDFITYSNNTYAPAHGYVLEDNYDGDNNYNACRTPWRIGQYALYSPTTEYDDYLKTFAKWSQLVTDGHPLNYNSGYLIVSGKLGDPIPDRDYVDMAFIAPLIVPASLLGDTEWYNALYNYLDQTLIENETYFGNTIKLLTLIDATGQSLIK